MQTIDNLDQFYVKYPPQLMRDKFFILIDQSQYSDQLS